MEIENQFKFLCIARKGDSRISFCLCSSIELDVDIKSPMLSISAPFTYHGILRAIYRILSMCPNAHSLVLVNGVRFSQSNNVLRQEGVLPWEVIIKFSSLKEGVVVTSATPTGSFFKFHLGFQTLN